MPTSRRGAADDDLAADAQRGDDARTVEDGVPGGNRLGLRADRLPALQCLLRAAELLTTTWRQTLNAATMLGQSKTAFQAEIDSASELIDFLRFTAYFAQALYSEQPISSHGIHNRIDYRPLEGFVYAITPFNFTAIGGNLPTAPALMGNVVVWKPAATAMLSNWHFFRILEEAGLPPGVINFVPGNSVEISDILLGHRMLAGIHFTGSTEVFRLLQQRVAHTLEKYVSYPR